MNVSAYSFISTFTDLDTYVSLSDKNNEQEIYLKKNNKI